MHGGKYSACALTLSVAPRRIYPYFYARKTITQTPPHRCLRIVKGRNYVPSHKWYMSYVCNAISFNNYDDYRIRSSYPT